MVAQILSPACTPPFRHAPFRSARAAGPSEDRLVDAELVRRFNTGDQEAFVEIVSRHRGRIFSVALRLINNAADAEEIAQDTFIRAYRNLARFRGDSSLSVWLHSIALNLSRNRYWYFSRRGRHTTLSLDCQVGADSQATYADWVACDAPSPARMAANREFSDKVSECITQLSSSQRDILTLINVKGRSYRQIADGLRINLGTVKSRISRARDSLRALLAETHAGFGPGFSPDGWKIWRG